jgi:RNA polymerase sigma-70 factor (ECF subfamily)
LKATASPVGDGRTQLDSDQRASGECTGVQGTPLKVPSFAVVYRHYFDFVWSLARRFGVEPEAMDDVVQEVFLVIHAKLDTLENPDALRSWIYGVVRRSVSSHRRARKTRLGAEVAVGYVAQMPSDVASPLAQAEAHADLQLLASLLSELDEPKREVFAMVELDELTAPEVAELLDIPLNTAYSRLRAARQAFQEALARHKARTGGR